MSQTRIRARPTVYKGVRMRSRLEAQVAQWFDQHAVPWAYEPVCFADEEGQYLPDFELKDFGVAGRGKRPLYVEVKPTWDQADQGKRRMQIIWSSIPEADLLALAPGYLDFAEGAAPEEHRNRSLENDPWPLCHTWLSNWGHWRDGPCAGLPAEAGLFHHCPACQQTTLAIWIDEAVCARCGTEVDVDAAIINGELPIPSKRAGGR